MQILFPVMDSKENIILTNTLTQGIKLKIGVALQSCGNLRLIFINDNYLFSLVREVFTCSLDIRGPPSTASWPSNRELIKESLPR